MKYGASRAIATQESESSVLLPAIQVANILEFLAETCLKFHEQGTDEVLDLSTLSLTAQRDIKYPAVHIRLTYETTN